MNWYNVEIPFDSAQAIDKANAFKLWLRENGIRFEASGCHPKLHFEIYAHEEQLNAINNALDEIVWC